jgi:hypothetical protein
MPDDFLTFLQSGIWLLNEAKPASKIPFGFGEMKKTHDICKNTSPFPVWKATPRALNR